MGLCDDSFILAVIAEGPLLMGLYLMLYIFHMILYKVAVV